VARAVIWQIPRRRFKSSYAITVGDNTLGKRQSLILKNSLIDTFRKITGADVRDGELCHFFAPTPDLFSSHTIVIDARNERNFGAERDAYVCVSERAQGEPFFIRRAAIYWLFTSQLGQSLTA
jgi:hypothetical protein